MAQKMCVTQRAAIAGAAALPFVHARASAAAGKLSLAFVSSFVPGWNEAIQRLVETWGKRNAVSTQVDVLSSTTNQIIATPAAEAQARVGHDVVVFVRYDVARYADQLEPVDALVAHLTASNGPPIEGLDYLAKIAGTWRATPTSLGSVNHSTESRIDLFRDLVGLDVRETFPAADTMGPGYDQWTWDAFLGAAEKCSKAAVPFGLPISNCPDANAWLAALFASFGAELIDAKGNVVVRSEAGVVWTRPSQRCAHTSPARTRAASGRALVIRDRDGSDGRRIQRLGATTVWPDASAPHNRHYGKARRDTPLAQ